MQSADERLDDYTLLDHFDQHHHDITLFDAWLVTLFLAAVIGMIMISFVL